MKRLFSLLFILLLQIPPVSAQDVPASPLVKARLETAETAIEAAKPFKISIFLEMTPGWHTYTDPPGDAGLPTELKWALPEGFTAGGIDWPKAEEIKEGPLTVYGYHGAVELPVEITPPGTLTEKTYTLKATATWLVCKDICIPESQELSIELLATPNASPATKNPQLASLLLFALLGGLILNLMPCVLPVLSLKALAVVKKANGERAHVLKQGIAYTLGILISFAGFAGVLLALKGGGEAVGWGFQMQSPAFVAFLIYLLFMVGLSLSGLFHLPVLLGHVGIADESSAKGSFMTGVLATAVATPCIGPFLASAIGATLSLPAWQSILIFQAIGLGLASPFLVISVFPQTLRFLPKPGAWMERFKELLAFPMYAAVIWLVWVLTMQVGSMGTVIALAALLIIVFIVWMKSLFTNERAYHLVAIALLIAVVALSILKIDALGDAPAAAAAAENAYSKEKVDKLRAQGKPVFIDATAAWCITCQVNKAAIHSERVQQLFAERNITFLVADWTRRDPEITAFLTSFGYQGVPLYVYYPPHGAPKILPQLLTTDIIIDTIGTP